MEEMRWFKIFGFLGCLGGSGHEIRGHEMEPHVGLLTQQGVCLQILSLCPSSLLTLVFSHSLALK